MKKYLPVLEASPLFYGMTDDEIMSALNCLGATPVFKEKKSTVFYAGEKIEEMGLVLSGTAFIVQYDLWGHRNILSRCRTGDFFGEPYASKPGAVLNINVETETDCEILFININRLLYTCGAPCTHHQKLISNLVKVLADKILIFNNKITHISKRTTRDKLLSYLTSESIKNGSLSFDIPFNRQQLADFLCVERAAMSVEISKLQKEGLLKTTRNHFELITLENV